MALRALDALALDTLDRRVLAGIVFVDCLGARVASPVDIGVPSGVRWFRKPSGQVVITAAPGLGDYAGSLVAPAVPAPGAVSAVLDLNPSDPGLDARRVVVALPRDPDPARMDSPGSLFRMLEVTLLPSPRAKAAGLVAMLYVTVTRGDDGRLVEGALVRLRPDGGRPAARACTDAAGVALLMVPGVPLASPGAGAVVRRGLPARLDVIVDPAQARFHAIADVPAARLRAAQRMRGFIDPDDIEARLSDMATPPREMMIAAGRAGTVAVAWSPE